MSTAVTPTTEKAQSTIRVDRHDDGLCVVTFDRPGSSANIFSRAVLRELEQVVDGISNDNAVKAVVFISAKKNIFVAGADVHEIASLEDKDGEMEGFVKLGQRAMQKIADLRPLTVAAIHGQALGGGCELALACDYRVCSDSKKTAIGLPEVMLGILPAWGGSTRMPRLVGLPTALDLVLAGKSCSPRKAKKIGLVDMIAPKENLLDAARKLIKKGRPQRKSHGLTNNAIARKIIANKARDAAMKKSGGHYPAIPRALDVMVDGLGTSIKGALDLELKGVMELSRTPVTKNLIGVFMLQERAKNLGATTLYPNLPSDKVGADVQTTSVIGSGLMGAGIAHWFASRGHRVVLRDMDPKPLASGMANIAKLFGSGVKRKKLTKAEARDAIDRVYPTLSPPKLQSIDLIVEAAVENMAVKKKIFAELEAAAGPNTILATNTSGLSITELATAVNDPGRVIGMHFFNPVHRMKLVEIIVGEKTDPEVTARLMRFTQKIGKLPIVCKDAAGFVVNRILMPYMLEAGTLFTQGADMRQIDKSMLKFGMPMGPIRLLDEVGIDTANHVANHFGSTFGDRMPIPASLAPMVEQGMIGRKGGKGFYVYSKDKKQKPQPNPDAVKLVSAGPLGNLTQDQMQQRMVLLMINEAARVLEEEIAATPHDVDLGMIMGTGFAPFRGGPMRYADSLGAERICKELSEWATRGEKRFEPCSLLSDMARSGRRFYQD